MRRLVASIIFVFLLVVPAQCWANSGKNSPNGETDPCIRIVKADIVALEQAYLLNRFSAFVPGGMLFALRRDVVSIGPRNERVAVGQLLPGKVSLRSDKRPRPLVLRVNEGECLDITFTNLLSPDAAEEGREPRDYGGRFPAHVGAAPGSGAGNILARSQPVSIDAPRTRAASFHVTGLERARMAPEECPLNVACGGDGTNVGLPTQSGLIFNPKTDAATRAGFTLGSLAKPGQTVVTRWQARTEGAYFTYSAAAPVGGEGDGGQIGLGLFGSVNVEPAGSRWYRSQVTHETLQAVTHTAKDARHPYAGIAYGARDKDGAPVLAMLDDNNEIVHSDLNAIIVPPELNKRAGVSEPSGCTDGAFGWECGRPFREFTVIFHDEVYAQQAFAELEDENDPISFLKDGMGINYGVSSMGSLMLATKQFAKGIGPAKDCAECRAEEFFLSSWANGDPALILSYGEDGKPNGARYRDDPSNVHHSYLGDPVRFRNLHAGPKETHVFHLHAHQWMQDGTDKNSTYLDSQTISPGATFSYAVEFGGSGNRNYTPADSIFHCHLYPHFAQGMWELWRVHDAFADGKDAYFDPTKAAGPGNDPTGMNLPDAEIGTGTQTAALVPIPGSALAPMPTEKFRGYPFYIPGEAGHRPPQPALDFDVAGGWPDLKVEPDAAKIVDGGLPRHIVKAGELQATDTMTALAIGGDAAQVIAQRVAKQDAKALTMLAKEWKSIEIALLDEGGERAERNAMLFHEGHLDGPGLDPVDAPPPHPGYWNTTRAYRTDFAGQPPNPTKGRWGALFHVNAQPRAQGAPFANPCPEGAPLRQYRAAFIQTELTYNRHGWFDPQGRIMILENDLKDVIDPDNRTKLPEPLFFRANSGECIQYKSTNLIPSALNVDDFQIFTPTDTIGQHIHLVKFDVTSSDGSGNGFNYEDATFSPLEVQERVLAFNRTPMTNPDGTSRPKTAAERLRLKVHPLFQEGGDIFQAAQRDPARFGKLLARGQCPDQKPGQSDEDYKFFLRTEHDFCGAQRTTQRWWADPILNRTTGKDNTLRTVFTHDHLGPSSHQQHGLYAGLVIEPANSVWTRIDVEPNGKTELPPERRLSRDEMAAIGDGSGLRCDLLQTGGAASPNDPGQVCRKVIGGSALGLKTEKTLLKEDNGKPVNPIEGVVEPRPPLILRGDGGPTASRANIVAPGCIADSDSNELQPDIGRNRAATDAPCRPSKDTRREFELAIADFGIAYNTALEPINPEPRGESILRDVSALRFGRRHVATALAKPLGISSEDPGSQYFNYRHEPVALRIGQGTVNAEIGGWDYRQNPLRADGTSPCIVGVHQDCLGDPANALSSSVHALRDERLAKTPLPVVLNPYTRDLLAGTRAAAKLDAVLGSVEAWRRRFNCMLYDKRLIGEAEGCSSAIERPEPGRVFGDPATPLLTAYEGETVQLRLIQGAQEAQHVFTINAVKWPRLPGDDPDGTEPDAKGSGFVNAQPLGISEHFEFNLDVPRIDGLQIDRLYFGSSTDQLWDGLWGVLRSYPYPRKDADRERVEALFGARGRVLPRDILAPLPGGMRSGAATSEEDVSARPAGGDKKRVCSKAPAGMDDRYFDVAVARVCDLLGGCDGATPSGLVYSTRFGIRDENAIVYVLEREGACGATSCDEHDDAVSRISNAQALQTLRKHYAAGRRLEPMILRAAAGQCLHVNLRNLLPPTIVSDGPVTGADGKPALGRNDRPAEVPEARAFYNFLPMITDGFNVNQFRMSSSVGLSPAKVTINPIWSDGSNVGLNATSVVDQGQPEPASGDALHRQGSLLPPCTGDPAVDGDEESRCRESYEWSLAEFAPAARGKPIEFAAVPLRSFGDPIKHPAHGLVGALVVGPEGSKVCEGDRFAQSVAVPGEETSVVHGTSAEICGADGAKLYADHVLVLQDGVSASRGGLPVPNLSGAEEPDDYGVKAINYRTDPLWARSVNDPSVGFSDRNGQDLSRVLSSAVATDGQTIRCVAGMPPLLARTYPCDPETPILDARPGETLRLSFVHPGGHTRQTGLAVSGHAWSPYPWSRDSRVFRNPPHPSVRQGVFNAFGPMMGVTFQLQAGGEHKIPLDYLIRSQASFQFDGGQWGLLRVRKPPVEAIVTSP